MNLRSHPYKAYRVSNNEWADQIPSAWEEKRVKDLFRLVTDSAPIDNNHELLSLYASIGVRPRKDLEARGNKASSTDGYWLVKKGDIVVNKLLAWMGSVGLSDFDGVTSPAYDVLRKTGPTLDERYFSYLFRTEIAKQIFKKNSRGIMDMRLRLYFDKLGAITVPVPPFSTQQAIAAYIDTKTAQIDRKIDLLSQKATQYGKLKQSLINETVTRGLDKSVPMKDSGVEWLGDIPDYWSFVRIKNVISKITSGVTPRGGAESYVETGIPFLRSQNVHNDGLHLDDVSFISSSTHQEMMNSQVKPGDIVFNITGASIARTCIVPESIKTANISQHIALLKLKKSNEIKFISYYLQSQFVKDYVYLTQSGASKEAFNHGQMKCIPLALPPRAEQKTIADYLDEKTAHIDRIVATLNTQIDKLKELRKTLINDIVTGKLCIFKQEASHE